MEIKSLQDAKLKAKVVSIFFKEQGIHVGQSQALHLISRLEGVHNWQAMRARIGQKDEVVSSLPRIPVRELKSGEWNEWAIAPCLSDRWGDLIQTHPLAATLANNSELLAQLQEQMWDEITFIANKDGQFGLLWEVEYVCQDSDPSEFTSQPAVSYEERVAQLMLEHRPLMDEFPELAFGVPEKTQVFNERPAIWVFMPNGVMSETNRKKLGFALLGLAYPENQED